MYQTRQGACMHVRARARGWLGEQLHANKSINNGYGVFRADNPACRNIFSNGSRVMPYNLQNSCLNCSTKKSHCFGSKKTWKQNIRYQSVSPINLSRKKRAIETSIAISFPQSVRWIYHRGDISGHKIMCKRRATDVKFSNRYFQVYHWITCNH